KSTWAATPCRTTRRGRCSAPSSPSPPGSPTWRSWACRLRSVGVSCSAMTISEKRERGWGAMPFNEALAARIREALARRKGGEEKEMFGGICVLLHGNLLVGVWKDSLIARLGPDQGRAALREPHVKEFDITGRPMRNWVLVEPEGLEGDDQLEAWVERAMKFVKALP